MPNISVKLFRQPHNKGTPHEAWLPFVRDVIAVLYDSRRQALMTLVQQVTSEGADQVIVTPSMFTQLLAATKAHKAQITSMELPVSAAGDERALVDHAIDQLKYHDSVDPDTWSQVLDVLHAFPPVRAEVLVTEDGETERFVVLSNGIIHCSDQAKLQSLGKVLEPAVW